MSTAASRRASPSPPEATAAEGTSRSRSPRSSTGTWSGSTNDREAVAGHWGHHGGAGAMSRYRTANTTSLTRDLNRAAIFRTIAIAGPIARARIAEQLGLSPATVTAVTRELLNQGLIRVAERVPAKIGRPSLLLELVGSAAGALWVNIAPDHLFGVRVNLEADAVQR